MLIIWNPETFNAKIWYADDQLVVCEVVLNGQIIMIGFVYAFNREADRNSLWEAMINVMTKVKVPWIFSGDFNCVCSQKEKLNGSLVRDADIKELRRLFLLTDAGYPFQW
ncbi:hypothetical protein QQ045_032737 [Rhodiola kirilowii]